jgi:hypothetical protein
VIRPPDGCLGPLWRSRNAPAGKRFRISANSLGSCATFGSRANGEGVRVTRTRSVALERFRTIGSPLHTVTDPLPHAL